MFQYYSCWVIFFFFWDNFILQFKLALNSFCSSVWPQIFSNPPAPASWVLRIQVCTTVHGSCLAFECHPFYRVMTVADWPEISNWMEIASSISFSNMNKVTATFRPKHSRKQIPEHIQYKRLSELVRSHCMFSGQKGCNGELEAYITMVKCELRDRSSRKWLLLVRVAATEGQWYLQNTFP